MAFMRGFFLNEVRKIRVLKTLSWRIIATCTTMFLAYIVTGQLEFVASIGLGDVVLKMIFYYMHEKAWSNRIRSIPDLYSPQIASD
ncbi:MAG: DUF2061 domain-containing protein [Candidatus Bathyarchaeia archaeon]|jgi:uncharacterized membrane protein